MPPKSKEKPVIEERQDLNEAVLKDQRSVEVKNPYDPNSEKRKVALRFLDDREIDIKPLRKER